MSDITINNNERFNLGRLILSIILSPFYALWSLGFKFVRWVRTDKWYAVGFLVVFGIGVFLRLWNLGKLGLSSDEGVVPMVLKGIDATGLPTLPSGSLYTRDLPFYYITFISYKLFGYTEFAMRLPSAISGLLIGLIGFFLSKEFVKYKIESIIVVSILLLHPWLIEFSRYSRSFILVVLLIFSSFYFTHMFFKTKNLNYLIALSISAFLSTLTHQLGQMVIFIIFSYTILNIKTVLSSKKIFIVISFATTLLGIFLLKYFFSFSYYIETDLVQTIISDNKSFFEKLYSNLPIGLPNLSNYLFIVNPIPLFFILFNLSFFINLIFFRKFNNLRPFFLTFFFFLLLIFCSKYPISENRAVLFLFPFFIITIFLNTNLSNIRKNHFFYFLLVFSLSIISISTMKYSFTIPFANYDDPINPYYSSFEGFTYRQDNKTPYEYLINKRNSDEPVFIFGIPNYSYKYLSNNLDNVYSVFSGSLLTKDNKDIANGIPIIKNISSLEKTISTYENKKVWIVTSLSIEKTSRINHINSELLKFLINKKDLIVYQSIDKNARVYLIK